MSVSRSLLWKVYTVALGTVTTVVAQKAVHSAWKFATGDAPPNPNDPSVPATEAAIWAIASGIGIGVAQLATNRFVARRWMSFTGELPPTSLKASVRL